MNAKEGMVILQQDVNSQYLDKTGCGFIHLLFKCWLYLLTVWVSYLGFPGSSLVKNLPTNAEDTGNGGLIPGLGSSPGEGNGTPLQYSCLENSMDGGAC